ncbi:hypothetical protein [Citrobacter freundii]|uniref:hypothetical protein n=1 Tax=Citrobacter freundii TaxID=546 RepID=UPI001F1A3BD4|nr:hypothetical protein [Citrobacter freundii]
MLGGADNANGDLPSYITGANIRRDLIRKVSGSREGIMILTALVSEIYVNLKGAQSGVSLDDLINNNISAINDAEDEADRKHFIIDEK